MRTFRRTHVDEVLLARRDLFRGRVLDVGGKRANKRGAFRPAATPAASWQYLNVDASSEPDFLCSAEHIPVGDAQFDAVMLSEVLEHLRDPQAVLREVRRVLVPGGRVVATMPFLFPVHGDPDDFQRWTPERLRHELEEAGLEVEEVAPMGSAAAVVFDLVWIAWTAYVLDRLPIVLRRPATLPFAAVKPLVAWVDARLDRVRGRMTTGYLVVGRRPATTLAAA